MALSCIISEINKDVGRKSTFTYVHATLSKFRCWSTKELCPFFDEIDILIPGQSPSTFHPLTRCEILIHYRNEEISNDFNEQFIELE